MSANESEMTLPPEVFFLLDPRSPGYERLKALPPVTVRVVPAKPAPTPPRPKPSAPLPPMSATDREIIRLRKKLGWPIPKCYEGRK